MKRESALGLALRLLGLALSLGPILIAFSMHNWNLQETLITTEGIESITGNISRLMEGGALGNINPLMDNATYDNGTGRITLPTEISGIPFSVAIENLSLTFSGEGKTVTLTSESPTEMSPGENKIINLYGFSQTDPFEGNWQLTNGEIVIKKLGVEIIVSLEMKRWDQRK